MFSQPKVLSIVYCSTNSYKKKFWLQNGQFCTNYIYKGKIETNFIVLQTSMI